MKLTIFMRVVQRGLVNLVIAVMGLALLADLAAWWLARPVAEFVWVVAIAGGLYSVTSVVALLAILVDLWWGRSAVA